MPGFGGLFQQTSEQRTRVDESQIGQVTGGLASSRGGTQALGGLAVTTGRSSGVDISVTTLDVEAIDALQDVALRALESQQALGTQSQAAVADVLESLEVAQQSQALSAGQASELAQAVAAMSPTAQQSLTTKVISYALVGVIGVAAVLLVVYAVKH